jgi:hypothetical protein
MQRGWILVAASLMGCVEYEFSSSGEAFGENNPYGLNTPVETDRVRQVTSPAVDVLWVVDNSCSMTEEQAALGQNFREFMNYFLDTNLDYHIGVVSTDMDDSLHRGILRNSPEGRWIHPDTEAPLNNFREMTDLGIKGSADEQGRAATYAALELRKEEENAGFIRDDATLHVVLVSDEDDYSGNSPIGLEPFVDYLKELKADPEMVTFSSIVGPPGGCGGGFLDMVEEGRDYIHVTQEVGGSLHSICTDDWSAMLDELGEQAARVRVEYFLTQLPVPGTIQVEVVTESGNYFFEEDGDWTYDATRNSVTFVEFIPPPLAEVFVTYEVLSSTY